MHYRNDAAEHARIFGVPDQLDSDTGPGRKRKCKTCGSWHRIDRPWPGNCRPSRPPRADLAAPRLAPAFEAFKPNRTTDDVIGSRNDKREYMRRNGLVEYDEGVRAPDDHWTERRAEERRVGQLIADIRQTDTEYLSNRVGFDVTNPERVDEAGTLDAGTEIETDGMDEVS